LAAHLRSRSPGSCTRTCPPTRWSCRTTTRRPR